MDLISLLPLEVSRNIFEYLRVDDLGRCLRVSKHWRAVGNDDVLWKHHCIKYGVAEKPDNPIYEGHLLCHWALVWKSFAKTSAYRWHCNKYKDLQLIRDDYTSLSLCGRHFTAYSQNFNNLDIFTVEENSNRVRFLASLALYLPRDDERATLSMSGNYIVTAKYNILLVFEKVDNNYDLIKAFAIVFNSIIYADRNFSEFVNANLNLNTISGIIGILDDNVWLTIDIEWTFVINIITHEMVTIFTFENYLIQGNFFTTWSEDEIRIYDKEGNVAISIDNVIGLEEVYANETLVAILRGHPTEESTIEIWDSATGADIFLKKMSGFTWSKLHPKEEVLYTLEASCRHCIYRITSWDVRTGEKLWAFDRTIEVFVSYLELRVVCDKYLVVWPCSGHEENFYLMDSKTGRVLYETARPPYDLHHISDSLWISVSYDHEKLFVRSYV